MHEFNGYLLTDDEFTALDALLKDIWRKKEHDMLVKRCKMAISFEISHSISEIGLAETKTIVRELARELRDQ